jgi:hypothetical protein
MKIQNFLRFYSLINKLSKGSTTHEGSVTAISPLECTTMKKGTFEDYVLPMLKILKQKADDYNCFIRLSV